MSQLTRRVFLTQSAAAAGLLARSRTPSAADLVNVPVIDTHLHCFAGVKDSRFPYHAKAPYRPDSAATPEHLLHCMDGAGVDFSVVVHPEPYQDDHRYLAHCLNASPRLKGTCLFFADRPGSVARMPVLVKQFPGRILTARVHAYAPDRLPPFGTSELRNLWKTATDLGLAMQLHFEPRYAPGLEPYIREFKTTKVIIDHLGRPFQGTPKEHAVVVRWANLPNTVMKVSAIPDQKKYPHRDITPVIRQLTSAWGADRMIYGGGFNADATPDSYRSYREKIAGLLSRLSAADREKIFGGTAAQLYGFK